MNLQKLLQNRNSLVAGQLAHAKNSHAGRTTIARRTLDAEIISPVRIC